MNQAQRIAGQVLSEANVRDAGISAAQAALVAAAQIAAGVDPGEAGWAALAGLGVGVAAAQPMAAMGRGIGRYMDRHNYAVPDLFTAALPGTRLNNAIQNTRNPGSPKAEYSASVLRGHAYDADGRKRGPTERDMSVIGRAYGDDIVRLAAQFAVPGLIDETYANEPRGDA